jgi:EpsI family protein
VLRNDTQMNAAVRSIVVAVLFTAAAAYLATASRAEELPPREPLSQLSMTIDQWSGRREADLTPEILAVLGVDDYITRTYRRQNDQALGLYIGYHTSQRQGDAIHSPLNCLPGAGWEPMEVGRKTIPVRSEGASAPPRDIEVNRVVIGKGLDRAFVLYWYQSHRRIVASEYWGKVYTVLDSVRYNRTDAAMVRIVVPVPDEASLEAAEAQATSFAQALFPHLPSHLPS